MKKALTYVGVIVLLAFVVLDYIQTLLEGATEAKIFPCLHKKFLFLI